MGIDFLVLMVLTSLVEFLDVGLLLKSVASILIIIIYLLFLENSKWQASLGKRVMNCYVIDKSHEKASFYQLLIRLLIYFLPALPLKNKSKA